jgi:hypothetical protein
MRRAAAWGTALLAAAVAGCTAAPGAPVPARFGAVLADSCAQQLQAFAEKQTGKKVIGAATAFAQTDQWVLDPAVPTDAVGRPLDGRQRMVAPEVFKLSMQGATCSVTHETSGITQPLQGCPCVAMSR